MTLDVLQNTILLSPWEVLIVVSILGCSFVVALFSLLVAFSKIPRIILPGRDFWEEYFPIFILDQVEEWMISSDLY